METKLTLKKELSGENSAPIKAEKKGNVNIYTKLLAFQKLGISVNKDADNPFFHSKYVTLNEVLSKVKKPLNDLGVLIVQMPQMDGLITKLMSVEDGTSVECFMPYVEATNAQKLGSNNTYNRRYSLVTLLGLEDEDDDGNKASEPVQETGKSEATPKQKLLIKDLMARKGYSISDLADDGIVAGTPVKEVIEYLLNAKAKVINSIDLNSPEVPNQ